MDRRGVGRRLGQNGVAEPAGAVNDARVLGRVQQRRGAARPDRNVRAPAEREHRAGVARRLGEIDIARDAGDAEDVDRGLGERVEQAEGVVDAGVDVEDDGRGGDGHR